VTYIAWHPHYKAMEKDILVVAIRKPERHVRKAQSSHAMITLLLLVRATYMWCCSSRTSRSWWITHLTQRQRSGCNIKLQSYGVANSSWIQ